MQNELIKTVSDNQEEIIRNIIQLNCPNGIDVDPTYSKGVFYRNIQEPRMKFDLYPQTKDTVKADASSLPISDGIIPSIMFDPPFLAGNTKKVPTGIIGERFGAFPYMTNLWKWYDKCLQEFYRILKKEGVLVVKCQDSVNNHKQWLSHVHIINEAEGLGFYTKDLYILVAKHRLIGHNHKKQHHARKFHSYFLVFEKRTAPDAK